MTGGTLLAGAEALREHGATAVWVFTTHGLFSEGALDRFAEADLAGIVVTDTVPVDPVSRPANLTVLPISGLLAETIMNVFSDESVSAIFGGEYQLFYGPIARSVSRDTDDVQQSSRSVKSVGVDSSPSDPPLRRPGAAPCGVLAIARDRSWPLLRRDP